MCERGMQGRRWGTVGQDTRSRTNQSGVWENVWNLAERKSHERKDKEEWAVSDHDQATLVKPKTSADDQRTMK